MKLNEDIAVSFSYADGDWCMGYRAGQDPCDCGQTDNTSADFCGVDYDRNGSISQDEKRVFSSDDFNNAYTLTGISFSHRAPPWPVTR